MKLSNLKKSYGGRSVLDIDALELQEGRVYAVIGANGSGKSTLAKLIAGAILPDSGKVEGYTVSIGYMPQKSYAFRMSLEKNLRINGHDIERMQSLMSALKISELGSAKAKKLSGGETARMALARLFMRDYDLYILDEPCSAMDIESTLLAEKLISERCKRFGSTVLIVTHSVSQAQRMADEVLFISGGKLIERASPEKLISAPESEETRRFLDFYAK